MPPAPRELLSRVQAWLVRHRLGLLVAAALVVALRALLPWGLARAVEWQAQGALGRRVEVQDIDLGLLAGRLAVEGLSVGPLLAEGAPPAAPEPEPEPERALLRVARLEGNFQWLGLLDGEAHVAELRAVGPELRIVVGSDGRVVPLVAPRPEPAEPEVDTAEDDAGGGLPLLLDLLSVENASFLLVNLAHPERPPLEFDFDALELRALALRAGELAVGGVGLRGPQLRLRRDIDLSAFQAEQEAALPEAVAQQSAATPPAPGSAPSLKVTEIGVEGAELALLVEDDEIPATLRFKANDVNLLEPFPVELGLEIEGGSFEIAGRAGVRPASFDGRVTWSALPLGRLALAAGALPVVVESGESDGELEVRARLGPGADGEAPGVSVSGRVASRAVSARLPAQDGLEAAFGWQDLGVGLDALELDPSGAAPLRVEIASLSLNAPQVRVARSAAAATPAAEGGGVAPAEGSGAASASAEPGAAPSPILRVASLELKNGALDFEDSAVSPPHRTRLRPIELSASDLRWPERQVASLALRARDEDDGSSLKLDLDAAGDAAHASLSVERLGLPSWSPYLAETAGYWVEDGQLTLEAKAHKKGPRLEIDGDLELLDLDVDEVKGGSFEEEFGVPLDLALALLRDPRGRIGVPVPVTLDEKGGGASLAPIIASVLRQAIVGALTSPLKGLGMGLDMVLGGGKGAQGMQLAPVAFAPGADAPASGEVSQLGGIADILAKRPGLSLVLHGRAGPADDPTLAEQILAEAVREDGELPPVSAGFFQKRRLRGALEKRAEGRDAELDAEDAEALQRWIAAVKVPQKRRDALAKRRAAALREELVSEVGLPAERIAAGDPLGGEPAVLIQLVTSR